MCGIVGYVGPREAAGVLLDGLSRLEYRGYDSAGLAVAHRRAGGGPAHAAG
jgi:glucosamine--fructose-6-phosphate aminotransferase (isomerizing)